MRMHSLRNYLLRFSTLLNHNDKGTVIYTT
jgi:hypothetical protein